MQILPTWQHRLHNHMLPRPTLGLSCHRMPRVLHPRIFTAPKRPYIPGHEDNRSDGVLSKVRTFRPFPNMKENTSHCISANPSLWVTSADTTSSMLSTFGSTTRHTMALSFLQAVPLHPQPFRGAQMHPRGPSRRQSEPTGARKQPHTHQPSSPPSTPPQTSSPHLGCG